MQHGCAEMGLQHLARRGGDRHRHVPFAAEREPEIEILAQQLGRKGRGPVEIDQRRRLVLGEHRAHHAVVHERQERVARHAHLVGEQRDLDQVLDHHAEHDIVCDLADARELAVAHVGDTLRREHLDQRHRHFGVGLGTGHHGRQFAGLDHLGVAGYRRGQEAYAAFGQPLADGGGFLDRDRRAIDQHLRLLGAAEQAIFAEDDLFDVLAGGDDREHHVATGEIDRLVDDLAAFGGQRLGLGAGAVPDRHIMAGLKQALGHRRAHAADPDPADLWCILRHHETPVKTLSRHPGRAGRLAGLDTIRQRETVAHACRPGGPDPDAAHACGTG